VDESTKPWIPVVFSMTVMFLVFACLTFIDSISESERHTVVDIPFQTVQPGNPSYSYSILPPNPNWKPVETGPRPAGGIVIEK
jgi:hypothetical protein